MTDELRLAIKLAHETCLELKNFPPTRHQKNIPRRGGIYAFFENGQCMYVGRTSNLWIRNIQQRCGPYNAAALAVAMARKATGRKATYLAGTGIKTLGKLGFFIQAFNHAKAQVEKMEFAWAVQENDAVQALAEIFATIELKPLFSSLRTS